MVWQAGQSLHRNRYTIQGKLGSGGFGITYLVKDGKGREWVVKTLKDEVMTSEEHADYRDKYLRDFQAETLRLAICRHRHIVQIENSFTHEDFPCILMEYVRGIDLWKRLKQQGALPEAEAVRYIQQIGEALIVVHDKGLLHRDLKPQNIMVRPGQDEAVLIDFGIAREFVSDLTQTHTLALTPGFAPIEQYDEREHRGEYTDVYALAATFATLVTGSVPPPSFMRAVRDRFQVPTGVSGAVQKAIKAGMAVQPEDRPQSVEAWLELLQLAPPRLQQTEEKDLGLDLKLDFREAVFGGKKEIEIPQMLQCNICAGTGFQKNWRTESICSSCNGEGQTKTVKKLEITIPAGVDTGTRLRVSGEGNAGRLGSSAGDLYVYLFVNEDKLFKRNNVDILSTVEISQEQAASGCNLNIDTLDSSGLLKIPSGTKNGAVLRLKGRGVPHLGNSSVRGDHLITINISKVSKEQVPARYQELERLLQSGDWKGADQETSKLMLEVANRTEEGWLQLEDIDNFPCEDLRTIDGYWVKHSNGRFGFSVQKRIYQSLGGTRKYSEQVWNSFADRVGWRKNGEWQAYNELTFSTQAPEAHLPLSNVNIAIFSLFGVDSSGWGSFDMLFIGNQEDFVVGNELIRGHPWLLGRVALFSHIETCKL